MHPRREALVGREHEQQRLTSLLADATAGSGRLVLVSGEAGIGKTTIVHDLVRIARERGALVLSGACYDLTTTPPYGPWSEAIRGYRPSGAQPLPPVWFGNPEELSKIGSQQALFEETRGFFASVASHQPLVIVLEDLHWADPASVDALRFLARTLSGAPVMLVTTHRDDEGPIARSIIETVPMLVREAGAERIDLRRWNESETRRLIADRYQFASGDEDRLTRYVHRLAEGNPFHTLELLRSLEGDGTLLPDRTIWLVGELAGSQVPPLVRQIVERRLERLPDETRSLLEIASLIGYAVRFDLWQAVSVADADRLATALDQALTAQLIDELPDRSGFQFRHALVRETLYAGVNPLRLRGLHRRVAERLIDQPAPDPDAIAHHLGQAGDPLQVDWLIRAGERAQQTFAWHAAVERFEAARQLLDGDPGRAQDRGWLLLRIGLLLRFSDQRASLQYLEWAVDEARQIGDRALEAFTRYYVGLVKHYVDLSGVPDLETGIAAIDALSREEIAGVEARIEASGPGFLPGVLGVGDQRGTLASALYQIGRLDDAIAVGEAFVDEVYRKTADDRQAAIICRDAHGGLAVSYAMTGRTTESRAMFARAEVGYRGIGNQWVLRLVRQQDLLLLVLPYYSDRIDERERLESFVLDAWRQAIQVVPNQVEVDVLADYGLGFIDGRWPEAFEAAMICSSPWWEAISRQLALWVAGEFHYHFSNIDQFWESVAAALPDGTRTEPGATFIVTGLRFQQLAAEQALDTGDVEQAREWLDANDRWFAWSNAHLLRAEGLVTRARYYRHMGDMTGARTCAERAREIASDPRQPLALAAARRALGQLDTLEGRFTSAGTHLAAALSLAERCRAPYEIAQIRLAQVELARAAGDLPGARNMLQRARKTFVELNARRGIDRADALAAALADAPEIPAGLSPREAEILCLIADGLSNRDIADRLYLSVRTVERHVTNIYRKIGAHNRVEASAFVQRHNLSWPDRRQAVARTCR